MTPPSPEAALPTFPSSREVRKNRLAIVPDQTHYDLFVSPRLVPTVMPFLDGKSATGTWK
jgi:hypothetical protein